MVENALTLKETLNERMIGGLHTLPDECDMLYRYASLEGDHVEIGCMWGGTAIIAALAKIESGVNGHVYTIDKMKQGFWDVGDPIYGRRVPTLEKVKKNFDTFGVSERVHQYKKFAKQIDANNAYLREKHPDLYKAVKR